MHPFVRSLVAVLVLGVFAGLSHSDDDQPAVKLSDTEQKILDMTNKAREKENLPPVKPNATLMKVARAHSANMAMQNKMAHELDGKTAAQRVKGAGYQYQTTGENVALGLNTPLGVVFDGWMNSPGHRANILNRRYEEIGIGAAKAQDGTIYYTQVFGTQLR